MMKGFPNFSQLDAMDCGPASIKIVAKYYGRNFSMKYLRDLCNTTREGVSLLDIAKASEAIGFRSLALRATYDDLYTKFPLPCILHWNYAHFVVLYRITRKAAYISDPQIGLVKYRTSEFCRSWKRNEERGYILVLEPGHRLYKNDITATSGKVRNYLNYLIPYKRFLIQVFFGMVMGVFVSLLFPLITQSIVDIGIETKDFDFIHILIVASIVLTISSTLSNFIQSRMMLFVADRVSVSMASDFIIKIMKLPISFFERKMISDVLARIADQNRIQSFILDSLLSVSIAVLSFCVYGIILIGFDFQIFLFYTLGTILYVAWIFLFIKRRKELDYKLFDAAVVNQNEVIQLIDGIHEIKINNLQYKKKSDWEHSRIAIVDLNMKMLNLSQLQNVGTVIIDKLKNIFVTLFSAEAVISGEITLGMMLAVQYIIGQMNGPVGMLIGYVQSYQDAQISLERVNEVTREEKEEVKSVGLPLPIPESLSIKVEGLSFAYHPHIPKVLNNISLEIPAGKMTAIVGASGSGKSTLIKLLLRFYDGYDGKIIVGQNTDLKSIDIDEWRANCGSILQQGKIFNDTILKNIVLDDDDIDIPRMEHAIDAANLREFINEQPLKLYTMLGYGGHGISGGQAQRLLIARALYKQPTFIFLDEATNSLDAKNEREITQHLLENFQGRTVVVIAHRLSTIKTADQIIVLDKGKVMETGTHDSLLVDGNYYLQLINNQLEVSPI
jgi:ATP-binding cassette subfamily B protein